MVKLINAMWNPARLSGLLRPAFLFTLILGWVGVFAQPDTLEIRLLKVQFAFEKTDNSLTTGRGHFDSDTNKTYSLDPNGARSSAWYWQSHLDFAANYYQKVSGGRLHIETQIYPRNKSAYELENQIIDYNRTARKKDEKVAEYSEARLRDYMAFVVDALSKAQQDAEGSPFTPVPQGSKRQVAYMVVHAGASRLLDGGSLGTTGANTPGDFLDVFVDSTGWAYLQPDAQRQVHSKGFVAGADTLRQVMVVSETASQDNLNWGINGVLVNQIGRQLGMPDTYDWVKGISRMGYFDVMDFAGYNAGNGFFPVLPSAWLRAHMGWATVREVRPGATGQITMDLAAAGTGLGTEIIKVPLTGNEYLLIENRQRSHQADGLVEVTLLDPIEKKITLPADSLPTLFLDSICSAAGGCRANSKKAKGVVVSTNAPDAALPASGIAVWHVNEWYLRERLPIGAVNIWNGDTLRDHQYGVALTEADGVLTIGKQFTNAMGQPAFDYGSGADLIPHQRFGNGQTQEVVTQIKTSGYGNTQTVQGGYSGIKISTTVPSGAVAEKNANTFAGDSVRNWRSLTLPVTIEWEQYPVVNGQWPKNLVSSAPPRSLVFAQLPLQSEKIVVAAGENGQIQYFSPRGDSLCSNPIGVIDSSASVPGLPQPVCVAGSAPGPLVGLAATGSHVFSLHQGAGLFLTRIFPDGLFAEYTRDSLPMAQKPLAGPMVQDGWVWVADNSMLRRAVVSGLVWADSVAWPTGFVPHELALCGDLDGDGQPDVVAVGNQGQLVVHHSASQQLHLQAPATAKDAAFRLVCSDFNRDNHPDAFVIGSSGHGWLVDLQESRLLAPMRTYKRGVAPNGQSAFENSAPAVADLNGDGYPNVVLLGFNRVYALDSTGLPLPNFPVTISRGEPQYSFQSDPLVVDVQGDGSAEILVPGTEGSVYAVSPDGKLLTQQWPLAAGTFAYGESLQPLSIYLAPADSLDGPELYALHRQGIHGFSLGQASVNAKMWALPGGGNARVNYFDATALPQPTATTAQEMIQEFFVFPNPVRGGKAAARFSLGAAAQEAVVDFFDIKGLPVFKVKLQQPGRGLNQIDPIDLRQLGSDVYSVRLTVRFPSGKKAQKWDRVGVVR